MSKELLEEKIKQREALSIKINEIEKELSPLQEESRKLYKEIRDLSLEAILPLSPEKILNTDANLFDSEKGSSEITKFLLNYPNLSVDSYYPSINRKALRVAFDQSKDVNKQIDDLLTFLKVMKPFVLESPRFYSCPIGSKMDFKKPYKRFNIMEETLSEFASYAVLVDENNMAYLLSTRGSSRITKILPLLEMMRYIVETHPYVRSNK